MSYLSKRNSELSKPIERYSIMDRKRYSELEDFKRRVTFSNKKY